MNITVHSLTIDGPGSIVTQVFATEAEVYASIRANCDPEGEHKTLSDGEMLDRLTDGGGYAIYLDEHDLAVGPIIDVRAETGIETYVNDEPNDFNPGVMVDSRENRGRALTSAQTRALAAELLGRADYLDSLTKETA